MTSIGQIQWSIRSREGPTEIAELENTNDIIASNQAEDSSTWDSKRDVLQRMLISKPAAEVLDVDD